MKHSALIITISALSSPLFSASNDSLQQEIQRLQAQTSQLQTQINSLQKKLLAPPAIKTKKLSKTAVKEKSVKTGKQAFHTSSLKVNVHDDKNSSSSGFYPTALIADNRIISYLAGTPVVTSPYLGDRPAFDGSDYIVNISSINRDIRLMQQRRRLYSAYESLGYSVPNIPIIAISGKSEPVSSIDRSYYNKTTADLTLGSNELAVAAALNHEVEAFMAIAYDETPPPVGPRVSNSVFNLNMGFVNIGDLNESPIYFTAGQLYVPFGRYSSSMISSTLPLQLARTKSRPVILGYKSQRDAGPYAAIYGFRSETAYGHSGIGGVNLGYIVKSGDLSGDVGAGYISSLTDSAGMQINGSAPFTNFGGFASPTNGSELVHKVPGVNVHGNLSFDRYSLTAEWVSSSQAFRVQDLSFNGRGAKPQAAQIEGAVTFMAFSKPASLAVGYQWSKDTLALRLPKQRINGVFNISLWKDTVESLEYRHDIDYGAQQYANGISAPGLLNQNTFGTGHSSDSLIAQIGVYF